VGQLPRVAVLHHCTLDVLEEELHLLGKEGDELGGVMPPVLLRRCHHRSRQQAECAAVHGYFLFLLFASFG
jgi:hypothetical protein